MQTNEWSVDWVRCTDTRDTVDRTIWVEALKRYRPLSVLTLERISGQRSRYRPARLSKSGVS